MKIRFRANAYLALPCVQHADCVDLLDSHGNVMRKVPSPHPFPSHREGGAGEAERPLGGCRAGIRSQAGWRWSLCEPPLLSWKAWGKGLWAVARGRVVDRNVSPLYLGLCALQFSTDICYQCKPKRLKSQETGSLGYSDASTAFAGHAYRKSCYSDTTQWMRTALERNGPDSALTLIPLASPK